MIFDGLRRQNPEIYTRHPLLFLPDKELMRFAEHAGFDDLDAFKRYLYQPKEEMTCPLCGHPQTHLSDCKGCGTGAYTNWDFEAAYGEDANKPLRAALKNFLVTTGQPAEKAGIIAKHTYDCMVCASCWQEAIATSQSYLFCPLRLFSEKILTGDLTPGLVFLAGQALDKITTLLREGLAAWLHDPDTREWRQVMFDHVFEPKEETDVNS